MPDTADTTDISWSQATHVQCGPFTLDLPRAQVLDDEHRPVPLAGRTFDLLVALLDSRAAPLSPDALRAKVWPGRRVAENNLRVQLTLLRRLLGRDSVHHLPGRGYQLALPVRLLQSQRQADVVVGPAPLITPLPAAPDIGNLPEVMWPLVGRDGLLLSLGQRLRSGARLSLVAPAGVGKTALGQALALRVASEFAAGAWWVELAALRDPLQLPQTVAAALALDLPREHVLDALVNALAGRRMLLVLDNCEHLRAATCELADRLMRAAPEVAVLATSRLPLLCAGEEVVDVPDLPVPEPSELSDWESLRRNPALGVFELRAQAADPRFRLRPDNAATVAEICQRLQGNAFAIALAAAQLPVFGLLHLRDSLDERLAWLAGRHARLQAFEHQQSLQATLAWSVDLLRESARCLLRRLGVFAGPFSLEAAAAVGATAEPAVVGTALQAALSALVEHGLVVLEADGLLGGRGPARYTMHESVRLHARQMLDEAGERASAQTALAHWLLGVLRAQQIQRYGGADPDLVRRLIFDVQSTVEWATEADPPLAVSLLALCAFGLRRTGQHLLQQRLSRRLLTQVETPGMRVSRIELLLSLCGVDYELERHTEVLAHTEQALALLAQLPPPDPDDAASLSPAGRLVLLGRALSWQGNVLAYTQGPALAEPLYRQALAVFREAQDETSVRQTLNNCGWVLQAAGRFDEARSMLEEALALNQQHADDWCVMVSHENLGELELSAGRPALAAAHFEREAALAARLPDQFRRAQALLYLVLAQLEAGEWPLSAAALREALAISEQLDFVRLQGLGLAVSSLFLAKAGDAGQALAILTLCRHLHQRRELALDGVTRRVQDGIEALVMPLLSAKQQQSAQARGELLDLHEVQHLLSAHQ